MHVPAIIVLKKIRNRNICIRGLLEKFGGKVIYQKITVYFLLVECFIK